MTLIGWIVRKYHKKTKKLMEWIKSITDRFRQHKLFKSYLEEFVNTRRMVVFVLPEKEFITGGILSIFFIAKTSRALLKKDNYNIVMATVPSFYTYVKNSFFRNKEDVFRLEQIVGNLKGVEKLILHIPEYMVSGFYGRLSTSMRRNLQKIPDLQINILNQNIMIMPEPQRLFNLYKLTRNVTQTTAHHRYTTQEICDYYNLPTHLIPANLDFSEYEKTAYDKKENLIAYSNDTNENKTAVLEMLKKRLPDYQLVEINNMTFDQYMETITKAKFIISFGEGFDSYLGQPGYVGSLGNGVYNKTFFPSEDFKKYKNVYRSYEDLIAKFADDVRYYESHPEDYATSVEKFHKMILSLYNEDDYRARIQKFYEGAYDFLPSKAV